MCDGNTLRKQITLVRVPMRAYIYIFSFLNMYYTHKDSNYAVTGPLFNHVVNRDSAYTHIMVNDNIVAGRSVFVHGQSPTLRFHPRPAAGIKSFLVHGSKIVNYHNTVAEDI